MKVQSGLFIFSLIFFISKKKSKKKNFNQKRNTNFNKISYFLTVLGDLAPNQMGMTLTHEHLSLLFDKFYTPSPEQFKGFVTDRKKISLDNLGVLRQYPYSSRYNIIFNDDETHEKVVEDLKLFKQWYTISSSRF